VAPRHLIRSYSATPPNPEYHVGIHPALIRFADECFATPVHLIAYLGALALLGIVGRHLSDELPTAATGRTSR